MFNRTIISTVSAWAVLLLAMPAMAAIAADQMPQVGQQPVAPAMTNPGGQATPLPQMAPTVSGPAVLLPNGTMSDGSIPTPEQQAALAQIANNPASSSAMAQGMPQGMPQAAPMNGSAANAAAANEVGARAAAARTAAARANMGASGAAMDPRAMPRVAQDGMSPEMRASMAGNPAGGAQPQLGPDGKPVVAEAVAEPPVTEFTRSFFYTDQEVADIRQAVSGRLFEGDEGKTYDIPAVRRIILSGIYYRGPQDWTIWMNGQKVTPKTLLPEIVDIKVVNDRIYLKWFDIGLNGIISLQMRPHQVYDIVTGVMLKE